MPTKKTDPQSVQAHALVPQVLSEMDWKCLRAFGRSPYAPGTIVRSVSTGILGTVLGAERYADGSRVMVDRGGDHPDAVLPKDLDPDMTGLQGLPPKLYRLSGRSAKFWHSGFEWMVAKHAKGAHTWDVLRITPGGIPIDASTYVVRGVGGRMDDAFRKGLALLDEARLVCPSPYASPVD